MTPKRKRYLPLYLLHTYAEGEADIAVYTSERERDEAIREFARTLGWNEDADADANAHDGGEGATDAAIEWLDTEYSGSATWDRADAEILVPDDD